jgi:hypothetical protein
LRGPTLYPGDLALESFWRRSEFLELRGQLGLGLAAAMFDLPLINRILGRVNFFENCIAPGFELLKVQTAMGLNEFPSRAASLAHDFGKLVAAQLLTAPPSSL